MATQDSGGQAAVSSPPQVECVGRSWGWGGEEVTGGSDCDTGEDAPYIRDACTAMILNLAVLSVRYAHLKARSLAPVCTRST